jgi:NAD(P)-dependent dehydrogenase (short-subunit alcohol dehydrogenase family)
MYDFSDQVVMISGADGNLGEAVVRRVAPTGANLVLISRHYEKLEATFPDLIADEKALFVTADLTDASAVQGMAHEAIASYGRIDILLNIAGAFRMGAPVHELDQQTWDFMLNVNTRSVVYLARAVVPHMIDAGRGKIVNVAARNGLEGAAKMGAYVVAKAGVIRLTETMSAELKQHGINVNCILPGTIDTPANRRAMPKADTSKWVAPEALADVLLFLASDAARAIHGASIPVYGLG